MLDSTTKRKIEESPNAVKEPESKMTKMSATEENSGDLIVLGLPWKTTSEEMKEYFQKFGAVNMAEVTTNKKVEVALTFEVDIVKKTSSKWHCLAVFYSFKFLLDILSLLVS